MLSPEWSGCIFSGTASLTTNQFIAGHCKMIVQPSVTSLSGSASTGAPGSTLEAASIHSSPSVRSISGRANNSTTNPKMLLEPVSAMKALDGLWEAVVLVGSSGSAGDGEDFFGFDVEAVGGEQVGECALFEESAGVEAHVPVEF